MNQLNNAFTIFLSLLVEAMPFLLLGVLLSGLLLLFIDEGKLIAIMPRNPILGAFFGSVMGFLFPVCECGNVPVARRLLMQGVPVPVAVGFLLAAPTINPIVIWSTWVAFRDQPEIVVMRVAFSLLIATIIGCVFSFQSDPRPMLQPAVARSLILPEKVEQASVVEDRPFLLQSGTFLLGQSGQTLRMDASVLQASILASTNKKPLADRLNLLLENTVQELRELGGVLVVGSAIAAAIQVLIPREVVLQLGQGPITSIAAMMLLAGLISICSTVDAFFALSFAATFTTGSLLAFLVFGPMIDLKGVGLMLSVFRPKAVIYLFGLAALLTFLLTLIINFHVS
ncbi:MAG: permease [Crinalium sp.]